LALVGGFSFAESQFDRAVQAHRQPGSSFKPIVYAAALDNGYTPATIVNDAVITIDQGNGQAPWKPDNYDKQVHGPQPLRIGIEKSRNLMTVRLAQDIGMPIVSEYARRFGVYDDLPPLLSMALGAGETTLLRLTTAYSMFVNGGKKIQPSLIDRIQDRDGRSIWRHDARNCEDCNEPDWHGQQEPLLPDTREQIIDPRTAYQIVSMLEGVVQHGTGVTVRAVGKPIAGKTGTSSEAKDTWFIGFSPDLAAGVFVGFDQPRTLGRIEQGATVAAPIFRDFMKDALADAPPTPFRVAPGIEEVPVDWISGDPVPPGTPGAIMEAFKAGTAPGEANASTLATITAGEVAPVPGTAATVGPTAAGRGTTGNIGEGTGGLY
jgi:penicillin-binding protein 1A